MKNETEKSLLDGTFKEKHFPQEWIDLMKNEPVAEIQQEANSGACELCGLHKCYNYLNGRLVEDNKFRMNYKPAKIQQCETRNAIFELDEWGRSCST